MQAGLVEETLSRELAAALHTIVRRGALPRVLRRLNDEASSSFDRSTYWLTVRLAETGAIRLSRLAELQGSDLSTISRQVQACEQAELVERGPDSTDARAAMVQLTMSGRASLDRMLTVQRAGKLAAMADWTGNDREVFTDLLARFASRYHAWADMDDPIDEPATVP